METITRLQHIRIRSGMYLGRLGDGSRITDGLYTLLREVVNNSTEESILGFGNRVDIRISESGNVCVRDYGRGIPDDKISLSEPGGEYFNYLFSDHSSSLFYETPNHVSKLSVVGLNGVGLNAVNALSSEFRITSFRKGTALCGEYKQGEFVCGGMSSTNEPDGVLVEFLPDKAIFNEYKYREELVKDILQEYACLNQGVEFSLNGEIFVAKNGLLDMLNSIVGDQALYTPFHFKNDDVEIAFTHMKVMPTTIISYVNRFRTVGGGAHEQGLRRFIPKVFNECQGTEYDDDVFLRNFCGIINVNIDSPSFVECAKYTLATKYLWEKEMERDGNFKNSHGPTISSVIGKYLRQELGAHLAEHKDLVAVVENHYLPF